MSKEEREILEQGYLVQLAKIMKATDIETYEELKEVYLKALKIIDKLIELEESGVN